MNILQKIIIDHYEEIKYTLHPRHSVMENIDRMTNCGDPSYGGAMYGCAKCGNLKFVPFRCKSRFCPTCGNKYSIDRTTSMSFKIINVKHRHLVFTIAEELRLFSSMTVLCLTVFFLLSAVSFCVCSTKLTRQNSLPLDLSLFCIPLAET